MATNGGNQRVFQLGYHLTNRSCCSGPNLEPGNLHTHCMQWKIAVTCCAFRIFFTFHNFLSVIPRRSHYPSVSILSSWSLVAYYADVCCSLVSCVFCITFDAQGERSLTRRGHVSPLFALTETGCVVSTVLLAIRSAAVLVRFATVEALKACSKFSVATFKHQDTLSCH